MRTSRVARKRTGFTRGRRSLPPLLALFLVTGTASPAAGADETPLSPRDDASDTAEVPDASELPAVAQADPPSGEGRPSDEVEQMLITARKHEENLQEVPESIIAFSNATLEQADITEFERLGQFAPNLQFLSLPAGRSTGAVQIGIRGRVQNDFLLTLANSVGFYVDDVFFGKSVGFPLEFLDIQRIEVLRGPQGTLYGKNSPSGAIRVLTFQPNGEWGAETDLRGGRFDFVQTRSTLSFPVLGDNGLLSDGQLGTLSGKVTFLRTARDEIFDNDKDPTVITPFPATGAAQAAVFGSAMLPAGGLAAGTRTTEGFLNLDRFGGQVSLLWEIGDFKADYDFDIQKMQDEPDAFQQDALFTSFPDGFGGTGSSTTILSRLNCSLIFGTDPARATDPSCLAGDPTEVLGPFTRASFSDATPQPGPTDGEVNIQGHSLVLEYDLHTLPVLGDVKLKSVTGHRQSNAQGTEWLQGAPYLLFTAEQDVDYDSWQQEIQAIGTAMDGNLDYVLGLFYFEEEGSQGTGALGSQRLPSLVPWCTANPANCFGSAAFFDLSVISHTRIDNYSIAPFGQATYTLALPGDQTLSFTGGGRYTHERRRVEVVNTSAIYTAPTTDAISGGKDFDNFSPMGSIAWLPYPDKLLYATVSRGFRSGGFNGRADDPATFGPFDDEQVTNVEWGFKTQWLDRRLQLNGTGFYQDWTDMQVTVFVPGGGAITTVQNAAEATFWGAEVEAVVVPCDGALLNIGYGLTLAQFDKFKDLCPASSPGSPICPPGSGGMPVDVKDYRVVSHHPEHTITWGASYSLPIDLGTVTARIGGYYQDQVNYSLTRNDHVQTKPYHTLDARLELSDVQLTQDVKALFALWGKNITDEHYATNGIDLGALGWAIQNYGERATFGAQVVVTWGAVR